MTKRINDVKRRMHIRFTGKDIALATAMTEQLKITLEMVYFLMNRGDEEAFVIILLDTGDTNVDALIRKQKRDTDILFEFDMESHIYALICQDTKVDGGYHFGERLLNSKSKVDIKSSYCIELEVHDTSHEIQYLIYKSVRMLVEAKKENRRGEILFKTLH